MTGRPLFPNVQSSAGRRSPTVTEIGAVKAKNRCCEKYKRKAKCCKACPLVKLLAKKKRKLAKAA